MLKEFKLTKNQPKIQYPIQIYSRMEIYNFGCKIRTSCNLLIEKVIF